MSQVVKECSSGTGQITTKGGWRVCGFPPDPRCWNKEWVPAGHETQSIGRCKYRCRHAHYFAPIKDCCLGKGDTEPVIASSKVTCCPDSFNNPTHPDCTNTYIDYCAEGSRIFSDARCKSFCSVASNNHWCDAERQAYCSGVVKNGKLDTDPFCKDYCANNNCGNVILDYCKGKNLDGEYCQRLCFRDKSTSPVYDCGVNLAAYCADPKNKEKTFCQCYLPAKVYEEHYADLISRLPINAQNELRAVLNKQPYCNYTPCSTQTQYYPRNIVQCPDVNVCINNATIRGGKIDVGRIDIKQSCPNWECSEHNKCTGGLVCKNGFCVDGGPGPGPTPEPDDGETFFEKLLKNKWFWGLLIGIVVLLVLGIMVVLL